MRPAVDEKIPQYSGPTPAYSSLVRISIGEQSRTVAMGNHVHQGLMQRLGRGGGFEYQAEGGDVAGVHKKVCNCHPSA